MDDRGRLVQSLKLKSKTRGPAAPRAYGLVDRPPARFAPARWCWLTVDLQVPRDAAPAPPPCCCSPAPVTASSKATTCRRSSPQIQDVCDPAANSAGFRIAEIALAGEHRSQPRGNSHLAGITGRSSLLFLDAGADARPAVDQSVDRASRRAQALSRPAADRDQGAQGLRALAEGGPRLR